MPTEITAGLTEGQAYASPFIGPAEHTHAIRLDVSGMSTDEVDADGYLKPGTPLNALGTLIAGDPVERAVVSGAVAGAVTVTGITTDDALLKVINLDDGADLTSEFAISDADEIDNTGGTDTDTDLLLVVYRNASGTLAGCVVEAVKVADDNTDLASETDDIDVAVCPVGMLNRDLVEDTLGRALTAAEVEAMQAGSIYLTNT